MAKAKGNQETNRQANAQFVAAHKVTDSYAFPVSLVSPPRFVLRGSGNSAY